MTTEHTQHARKLHLKIYEAPTNRQLKKAENFNKIEEKHGYPEGLLLEIWRSESDYGELNRKNNNRSPAGAQGDFQFMPWDRQQMIDQHGIDPWDKNTSIHLKAKACAYKLDEKAAEYNGNILMAVCGYNCREERLKKEIHNHPNDWFNYIPKETQKFATGIFKQLGYDLTQPESFGQVVAMVKTSQDLDAPLLAQTDKAPKIKPAQLETNAATDSTRVVLKNLHKVVMDTTKLPRPSLLIAFAGEADQNMIERPAIQKFEITQLFTKEPAFTK